MRFNLIANICNYHPLILEYSLISDSGKLLSVSKRLKHITEVFLIKKGFYNLLYDYPSIDNTAEQFGLSFPSVHQIGKMTSFSINEIYNKNLITLLSLMPKEKIPLIGFHGTDKTSMSEILKTKRSGKAGGREYLCIASYGDQSSDKVKFLAELYICAYKAIGYGDSVLIVNATNAVINQTLGVGGGDEKECKKDHLTHKIFAQIIKNCSTDGENVKKNVVERHLEFDSSNFSEISYGATKNPSKYPRIIICDYLSLSLTTERFEKGILMTRLKIQELVFDALYMTGARNLLSTFKDSENLILDYLQQEKLEQEKLSAQMKSEVEKIYDCPDLLD